jgi:hypothetical protein
MGDKSAADGWGVGVAADAAEGGISESRAPNRGERRTFADNLLTLSAHKVSAHFGFGWKMRAKIGDRKRWYELPEEVDGGS